MPKKKKKKSGETPRALTFAEGEGAPAAAAAAAPTLPTAALSPTSAAASGLLGKLKSARSTPALAGASAASAPVPDLDSALAPCATTLSPAAAKKLPKALVAVDSAVFSCQVALPGGLGHLLGEKTEAVLALARGIGTVVKVPLPAGEAVRARAGAGRLSLPQRP